MHRNFQIKLVIDVTPILILFDLSVSLGVSSQQILAVNDHPTVLTAKQSGQLYVLLFLRESLTVLRLEMADHFSSLLQLDWFSGTEIAGKTASSFSDQVIKTIHWSSLNDCGWLYLLLVVVHLLCNGFRNVTASSSFDLLRGGGAFWFYLGIKK